MRVEVYRNLHRQCFSVRALEGPKKGKVILHTDAVLIKDAEFVVQKGGQARVRRTGHKQIHAFVRGEIRAVSSFASNTLKGLAKSRDIKMDQFTYNPYENDTFIDRYLKAPVMRSDWAALGINGNWYINEVDHAEQRLSA
jgi:hypothetical protein